MDVREDPFLKLQSPNLTNPVTKSIIGKLEKMLPFLIENKRDDTWTVRTLVSLNLIIDLGPVRIGGEGNEEVWFTIVPHDCHRVLE